MAFLRYKSKGFDKFKIFKALEGNQTGCIKNCIRSDRGGEFTYDYFVDMCNECGIKNQFTVAGKP